ncbi:Uncharacterized protein Fot_31770 [Forsythia ovata]|uniref:Uncharacterized protein n=1 Tax=Forsythia ovata TaxID=205694 RepID=A0ABD1T5V8_9LAMI
MKKKILDDLMEKSGKEENMTEEKSRKWLTKKVKASTPSARLRAPLHDLLLQDPSRLSLPKSVVVRNVGKQGSGFKAILKRALQMAALHGILHGLSISIKVMISSSP